MQATLILECLCILVAVVLFSRLFCRVCTFGAFEPSQELHIVQQQLQKVNAGQIGPSICEMKIRQRRRQEIQK
jgi:hypothetical protein